MIVALPGLFSHLFFLNETVLSHLLGPFFEPKFKDNRLISVVTALFVYGL